MGAEDGSSNNNNSNNRDTGVSSIIVSLLVILIVFVSLVAAGGLVLGALAYMGLQNESEDNSAVVVGLTGTNGASSSSSGDLMNPYDDGAVWRIAINHWENKVEYLDEAAGLIKGYNVDIVNAVCRIAGKNCQIVQDSFDHCWVSVPGYDAVGGLGLMGGYYEACTGWYITRDRLRVFDFTDSIQQARPSVFLVKPGNIQFQWDNLAPYKIGFLATWAADEHCVNGLSNVEGIPLASNQVHYYQTQAELEAAVLSDEITAAFVAVDLAIVDKLEIHGPELDGCLVGGGAMMTRKGSAFSSWWNPAFKKLIATREYEEICGDADDVHGASFPGPPKEELCV